MLCCDFIQHMSRQLRIMIYDGIYSVVWVGLLRAGVWMSLCDPGYLGRSGREGGLRKLRP